MVVSASVSTTGAVKRPSSSMQEDCVGWENAPPMGMPLRTSVNLPFTHYAMIYLDNMGKLKVSESPSIREQNGTVFTSDVREKFLEILGTKIGYHKPLIRRFSGVSPSAYGYAHPDELSHHVKRRKASIQDPGLDMHYADHYAESVEEVPPYSTTNMVGLEVGDTEKVLEYYENALKHFQQLNCRQIAKAFIKFIEPRKQVKHPYNGGKPRAGAASGEKGDPEKTKPEWWPAGVVHKEPDHLRKEQRIKLLIHIVRKLGRFNITPEKLQEVAHDSKRQLRPTSKIEVLDEIFKVRRMEERFERGEVDSNTMVYVVNRDANQKGDKDSDSVSEPEQKVEPEEIEDPEESFLPPSTSAQQASSFTSVDMPIPGRSMHLSSDREQLFPLPDSLSFGEQSRADRPYYSAAPDYTDDYSPHAMLKTPVTSALVSPNETTGSFEYMTQAPFSASTAGELSQHRPTAMPMQHSVSHFDSWNPSFRQNVYNPLEYGTGPTQTISQSPMSYQMPVPSPHAQDIQPHGLPEPISHKAFRTGSLGHQNMMTSHHTTTV
ncbi:hypothetical protein FE257_009029 [Aspergillus nanangensis]|uniref:Subtelomeric hrmA-associated cluster protein AFUB-079030/YDR124W-like helical bundle domain-containing protein n=1 Tax=Aspergillus nanangensis TaxID=2582783 RepID=A0AAD4GYL7_ASPNN|nr:hypothetical protein FE257_009029 [Aspergillus nanangensis]